MTTYTIYTALDGSAKERVTEFAAEAEAIEYVAAHTVDTLYLEGTELRAGNVSHEPGCAVMWAERDSALSDPTTPVYDGGHVIIWDRGDAYAVEVDDSLRDGGDGLDGAFAPVRTFARLDAAIAFAETL